MPECQILRCQHGPSGFAGRRVLLSSGHPILGWVQDCQLMVRLWDTTVPTGRSDGIRTMRQRSMDVGTGQVIHDFVIEGIAGSG